MPGAIHGGASSKRRLRRARLPRSTRCIIAAAHLVSMYASHFTRQRSAAWITLAAWCRRTRSACSPAAAERVACTAAAATRAASCRDASSSVSRCRSRCCV